MSAACSRSPGCARLRPGSQAAVDPPPSMLVPLVVLAAATIYFGIDTEWTRGHRRLGGQGSARRAAMSALAPERLLLLALLAPFVGALVIPLFHRRPNLRETATLAAAVVMCAAVLGLLGPVLAGGRPRLDVIDVRPGTRARLRGRAARHAVRAGRLHAVDRQLDLFDRLHARQQGAAADQLLRLLRAGARQHHRHRLRREPVHAVPVLRGADGRRPIRW